MEMAKAHQLNPSQNAERTHVRSKTPEADHAPVNTGLEWMGLIQRHEEGASAAPATGTTTTGAMSLATSRRLSQYIQDQKRG
jgi:hypothetical protein